MDENVNYSRSFCLLAKEVEDVVGAGDLGAGGHINMSKIVRKGFAQLNNHIPSQE